MRKLIFLMVFSIALTSILTGVKIATLNDILQPKSLYVVNGTLYILDQCKANALSMDNFKIIQKIGSQGEGPGQLQGNCAMVVVPNKIILLGGLKIAVFSTEGKLLKEKRLNFMFGNFQSLRNNYIFNRQSTENGDTFSDFVLMDENLNIGKHIYRTKTNTSFPNAGMGKKTVQLIDFTKFIRTG